MKIAARTWGKEERAPALPILHEAILVEKFGATAFPEIDSFRLAEIAEVLYIRDLFAQAGRKGQEESLSEADWEYIKELNQLTETEAEP